MTDKLTQTQELSRFLCQEQIICKYKFQDKMRFDGRPYCTCFSKLCEDLSFICDDNCQIYEDYKQLKHKEQECEVLKSENFTFEELIKIQDDLIEQMKNDIERYRYGTYDNTDFICTIKDYLRMVGE